MNPVRRADLVSNPLVCPRCSHKPYTYKKNFFKHIKNVHDDLEWGKEFIQKVLADQDRLRAITEASTADFRAEIMEELEKQRERKSAANAAYYIKTKDQRKEFEDQWKEFTT